MWEWIVERGEHSAPGRSRATAFGPFVWVSVTSPDREAELSSQTRTALDLLDNALSSLGTERSSLLSVQVYLAKIEQKAEFDQVWTKWLGSDPSSAPQRVCIGAQLSPGVLVEVAALAGRQIREGKLPTRF